MRVARIDIRNFRGVKTATIDLPRHAVLLGDNNTGKTTVLEALDLTLGPDRLSRTPPIDEHDFYRGKYILPASAPGSGGAGSTVEAPDSEVAETGPSGSEAPEIKIEVTVIDLSDEQLARFGDHVEFWDQATNELQKEPPPEATDSESVLEALRITFRGFYDAEEDDFVGSSFFTRTLVESEVPTVFTKKDKQVCGFLYLRSLRTGSRALSLQRGSLLDVILRLKEVRPRMWEDTLE